VICGSTVRYGLDACRRADTLAVMLGDVLDSEARVLMADPRRGRVLWPGLWSHDRRHDALA
jgi:hypothetical protein